MHPEDIHPIEKAFPSEFYSRELEKCSICQK